MRKFKITDGYVRKVEKRFEKVIKKSYSGDGLFVVVDGIMITAWGDKDFSLEYKVRWGRMVDGNCKFQHQAEIYAGDGNLDFLAGQFYEKVLAADGNE